MRKCLYGILAAVFLCTWKAEKTDANDSYAKYFDPFCLYNDADWLYNGLNIHQTKRFLEDAEEYVNSHPDNFVSRDSIIKQHIYISALRNDFAFITPEITRSLIMLNVSLTLEAFDAAVTYRVCAFFYSKVYYDAVKHATCLSLSLYLEWYFSFMLEEKAEDLCKIKKYFSEKENTFSGVLKAEDMCEILKKLNLNFLRFPEDRTYIPSLEYDDNNVFDPDVLTMNDSNDEKHFISIFERYKFPSIAEFQSQDEYHTRVYKELWNLIMSAYTDKFSQFSCYMLETVKGLPHKQDAGPMLINFQYIKVMWDFAPKLVGITTLSTETERGAVSYTNGGNIQSNIGRVMYRSNAVEILRQISYYYVLPTFIITGLNVYDIMEIINSNNPKCYLEPAPKELNLSVDYIFRIECTKDMTPLLLLN